MESRRAEIIPFELDRSNLRAMDMHDLSSVDAPNPFPLL